MNTKIPFSHFCWLQWSFLQIFCSIRNIPVQCMQKPCTRPARPRLCKNAARSLEVPRGPSRPSQALSICYDGASGASGQKEGWRGEENLQDRNDPSPSPSSLSTMWSDSPSCQGLTLLGEAKHSVRCEHVEQLPDLRKGPRRQLPDSEAAFTWGERGQQRQPIIDVCLPSLPSLRYAAQGCRYPGARPVELPFLAG